MDAAAYNASPVLIVGAGPTGLAAAMSLARAHIPVRLIDKAPQPNPYSRAIGISIFEEGKDSEGVDENGNFLYKSIKEALDDGWRILKFPEMNIAMDDQSNYGLGYEFILERWR